MEAPSDSGAATSKRVSEVAMQAMLLEDLSTDEVAADFAAITQVTPGMTEEDLAARADAFLEKWEIRVCTTHLAVVEIHGLQSKPELNGSLASVEAYDAAAGRVEVVVRNEALGRRVWPPIRVKPSNLRVGSKEAYDTVLFGQRE